ncbi:MAG: MmcB family DNA repair protein [Desulfovibrio sp.]|jgi:hypothetical protein|nr:MmcB family DNA repair protein [Desulfovibrio sp.]
MSVMSHSILVARASAWLRRNGFKVALPELYTAGGEIPDAWGLDSGGQSCIVEVKVSRSDFLRDAKKWHRRNAWAGMGNIRYYMAPTGIIKPEELPEGWGLLVVRGRIIRREVEAAHGEQNHTDRADKRLLYSVLRRLDCAGILRGGLSVASLQIKVSTERERLERELRAFKRRTPEALQMLSGAGA